MLPAHLMGNMWQQDWGNLWDLLQPYQGAGGLDITGALQRKFQQDYTAMLAKHAGVPSPAELVAVDREEALARAKDMPGRAPGPPEDRREGREGGSTGKL